MEREAPWRSILGNLRDIEEESTKHPEGMWEAPGETVNIWGSIWDSSGQVLAHAGRVILQPLALFKKTSNFSPVPLILQQK